MQASKPSGALVGLIAASDAIVAKYATRRPPGAGRVPPGFELPTLQDVTRLLHPSRDGLSDHRQRMARVTALAGFHALEARRHEKNPRDPFALRHGGYAERLAAPGEAKQAQLRGAQARALLGGRASATEICRYCSLFNEVAHPSNAAPIEVLNHRARITSDFNYETSTAEAGIEDFQLFMPESLARQALTRSHPFNWHKTADDMFDVVCDARQVRPKPRLRWAPSAADPAEWFDRAWNGRGYVYEEAKFPFNEGVYSRVHNVLAIDNFADMIAPLGALEGRLRPRDGEDERGPSRRMRDLIEPLRQGRLINHRDLQLNSSFQSDEQARQAWSSGQVRVLSYRYSLEACLGSTYGIGWEENSGLDIDDGLFSASAIHHSDMTVDSLAELAKEDLSHFAFALARRYGDAAEQATRILTDATEKMAGEPATEARNTALDAMKRVAAHLKQLWGEKDPWLVTISARKRLRYTVPRLTPQELWVQLTWITPAFLFAFINRSVCQLPHFVLLETQQP